MTCQVKIRCPQLKKTLSKNGIPKRVGIITKKKNNNRKPLYTIMDFWDNICTNLQMELWVDWDASMILRWQPCPTID